MKHYIGTSQIAAELGVSPATVACWLNRYPTSHHNAFPAPDIVYETPLRRAYGWDRSRRAEILTWFVNR